VRHIIQLAYAVIVVASCIFACGTEPPGTRQSCEDEPGRVRVTFAVDRSFTDAERLELQRATDDWFIFSDARVSYSLSYDLQLDEDESHIYRVESWMQVVKDRDAASTKKEGKPFYVLGWSDGTHVFLVMDRLRPDMIRIAALHEFGHVAGLEWPNCSGTRSECVHSPDPAAVMAPALANRTGFTASDLQFCRASCLCP
jgi:pimeloyl-ACP methyl ester carboxylesterase